MYSSFDPIRLTGLMMDIDMSPRSAWLAVLVAFAWFVGMLGSARAEPVAGGKVWVVDGLHLEQITALGTKAEDSGSQWMRLYRLTDPAPRGLECCLVTKSPVAKNNPALGTDSGPVLLTIRDAIAQPFIGIALTDGDATVRRKGPQSIEVLSKRGAPVIRVHHCVSQEGMRIDVEQDLRSRTYYVPLGMDVEVLKKYRCDSRQ